jgi:hypothetical protein
MEVFFHSVVFLLLVFLLVLEENGISNASETGSSKEVPAVVPKNESLFVLCAVMLDEDLYIDEWVLYNKKLGFHKIHIYDNNNTASEKLASVAEMSNGFVHVEHLPGKSIQIPSYNKCLDQYRNSSAWVTLIDCDEFIVLRKHATIVDLVYDVAPRGGSLRLNRVLFGNNGQQFYSSLPVVQRFTKRMQGADPLVKSISYLPHVVSASVHAVELIPGTDAIGAHGLVQRNDIHALSNHFGSEDIAVIHHYKTKSYAEFVLKRRRGDAERASKGNVYRGNNSEAVILKEFLQYDNFTNLWDDTRALDFFLPDDLIHQLQDGMETFDLTGENGAKLRERILQHKNKKPTFSERDRGMWSEDSGYQPWMLIRIRNQTIDPLLQLHHSNLTDVIPPTNQLIRSHLHKKASGTKGFPRKALGSIKPVKKRT